MPPEEKRRVHLFRYSRVRLCLNDTAINQGSSRFQKRRVHRYFVSCSSRPIYFLLSWDCSFPSCTAVIVESLVGPPNIISQELPEVRCLLAFWEVCCLCSATHWCLPLKPESQNKQSGTRLQVDLVCRDNVSKLFEGWGVAQQSACLAHIELSSFSTEGITPWTSKLWRHLVW